jgi:hypothetical protein
MGNEEENAAPSEKSINADRESGEEGGGEREEER